MIPQPIIVQQHNIFDNMQNLMPDPTDGSIADVEMNQKAYRGFSAGDDINRFWEKKTTVEPSAILMALFCFILILMSK